ncbi:MAG: hypothetical protein JXD18_13610, partial [Anaerolineae bacterium]|nr:hypothetical protein [Anaerolineae bacterium]
VPVAVQPVFNGYGENTLVWEPSATFGVPPAADTAYTVHVNNVRINSVSQNFTYEVIVFDPNTRLAASGSESAQLGIPLRFPLTEPCR